MKRREKRSYSRRATDILQSGIMLLDGLDWDRIAQELNEQSGYDYSADYYFKDFEKQRKMFNDSEKMKNLMEGTLLDYLDVSNYVIKESKQAWEGSKQDKVRSTISQEAVVLKGKDLDKVLPESTVRAIEGQLGKDENGNFPIAATIKESLSTEKSVGQPVFLSMLSTVAKERVITVDRLMNGQVSRDKKLGNIPLKPKAGENDTLEYELAKDGTHKLVSGKISECKDTKLQIKKADSEIAELEKMLLDAK